MPLWIFELLCLVIVAVTLTLMSMVMARRQPLGELLPVYGALAIAGWIGEASCVAWYRHYEYHAPWHARVVGVPLLVPLIWPLVILSARDVVSALWPDARWARPLLVGALVVFDASLVEVVAVRAGLWRWAEPGYLGVPLIGILGWGYFAGVAEAVLVARKRRQVGALPALIALAPFGAHAIIQATWWGAFRWGARGDLGPGASIAVALLGVAAAFVAMARRRAGHVIPLPVAIPRMVAAALFLVLLVVTAPASGALWLHVAAVGVPYLLATEWRVTDRDLLAAPRQATPLSR